MKSRKARGIEDWEYFSKCLHQKTVLIAQLDKITSKILASGNLSFTLDQFECGGILV